MTESAAQEVAVSTPVKTTKSKKAVAVKTKSATKKAAPTHPPTAQMVNNAIKNLKERGGSSLQAIKKYIASTYKVDAEKVAPFIKKYLKSAVDGGTLIRTKGKGASGSFKLAVVKAEGVAKSETKSKPAAKKTPKPKKAKNTTTPKKPKAATKPKTVKPKSTTLKKAPSKAKKTAKAPVAKKPKTPKPKKTTVPKKVATKKPAKK